MEPMKPMQPMAPMEAVDPGPAWWPRELGRPASSGGQNDFRYAFFPDHRRLAVERGGRVALYDSGEHRIAGVSQEASGDGSLVFTTPEGEVALDELAKAG